MEVRVKELSDYLLDLGITNQIEGDMNIKVAGFSSLFNYKPGTMTFIVPERKAKDYLPVNQIALILMSPTESFDARLQAAIRVKNPRKAFFIIVDKFYDKALDESLTRISAEAEIYYKQSYISDKAIIGKNVKVGIGCVIEGDVEIGENTEIHHNVVIRNGSKIGKNCTIFSGTIIGERGFNYFRGEDGKKEMIKHYGGVLIEDEVHIGDNCCISRGAIDDTVIEKGVKINKSAVIAHNVKIKENTIITTPVFICGSVEIGKGCHVAASIVRNQVSVGDNAILGLGCVVVKNVETGETVVGNPAQPLLK